MKRFLTFILCLVLTSGSMLQTAYAAPSWPDNVSVSAEAGVVIDARSGAVLYGKNIHLPYYPASITKILTALVVIENCNLDDIVTFSQNAVYSVEAGSSSAGMDTGDQLTVRDCLYAMMLKSANEVANALAEHTAGSIPAFSKMMNEKAASLGCTDSHFNNPSGLNDPRHYTSAYDMALIAQAAFQNETFSAIDSSLSYDLPATKRNPDGFRVYPGHRMMKKNTAQYYPGIIGGKTGYTSLAGNTLVTCAERDGMKLIAVVLNGHQTHYIDTKAMLDFGFANFRSVNIADLETTYASIVNDMTISGLPTTDLSILRMQDNCRISLPNAADFSDAKSTISYELSTSAPAHAIARISYQYNDRQVGAGYLIHNEAGAAATQPAVEISSEADTEADTYGAEGNGAGGDGAGAADDSGNADAGARAAGNGARTADGARTAGAAGTADDSAAATSGLSASLSSEAPAKGFHIPAIVSLVLAVILLLAALIGGLILLKVTIEKREEAERTARYQRRQKRLSDMGMSSSDFDLLIQQKRSDSALRQTKSDKRRKHHKSFLDSKR
ncbi:MAG: D-alanyl-D-alanine carboxypeptidase [Lachnospiraceae bacterium]|nr:D-alanyl-D-alanine carboxypeptidase [Lachnospiraceae bacterium]